MLKVCVCVSPEVVCALSDMSLRVEEDGGGEGAVLGAEAGGGDEVLVTGCINNDNSSPPS